MRPQSVAVIGASETPGSVGKTLTENILSGGFDGAVWLVNPQRDAVAGRPCFNSVEGFPPLPSLP